MTSGDGRALQVANFGKKFAAANLQQTSLISTRPVGITRHYFWRLQFKRRVFFMIFRETRPCDFSWDERAQGARYGTSKFPLHLAQTLAFPTASSALTS